MVHYYTGAGINDVFVEHLNVKIDKTIFFLFWKPFLFSTIFICLLVYLGFILTKRDTTLRILQNRQLIAAMLAVFCPITAIAFNPVPADIKRHLSGMRFGFIEKHLLGISEFFDHMEIPVISTEPDTPKNFLYIYTESLEKTFLMKSASLA